MELTDNVKKTLIKGLLGLSLLTMTGCAGSCARGCNDLSREMSSQPYVIELYSSDGKMVFKDSLNTYIQLSENGSGIRYLKNDKSIILNGTYVIKEQ